MKLIYHWARQVLKRTGAEKQRNPALSFRGQQKEKKTAAGRGREWVQAGVIDGKSNHGVKAGELWVIYQYSG